MTSVAIRLYYLLTTKKKEFNSHIYIIQNDIADFIIGSMWMLH